MPFKFIFLLSLLCRHVAPRVLKEDDRKASDSHQHAEFFIPIELDEQGDVEGLLVKDGEAERGPIIVEEIIDTSGKVTDVIIERAADIDPTKMMKRRNRKFVETDPSLSVDPPSAPSRWSFLPLVVILVTVAFSLGFVFSMFFLDTMSNRFGGVMSSRDRQTRSAKKKGTLYKVPSRLSDSGTPPTEATRIPLTNDVHPTGNDGWDNRNNDLILYTNDVLFNDISQSSYLVVDKLGQGTFGQVVRCWSHKFRTFVAVKIIKNSDGYRQQGFMEAKILEKLRESYNPDQHNFVRLLEYFTFKNHPCLACELLQMNLFELIRTNGYTGLSLRLVKHFIQQVLKTLTVLYQERIIHADLKPENVLLREGSKGVVKVIDFGSSCMELETVYSYIQSRFYRSPEVILSHPYDSSIDIWSLGCIAAELFLGLPLFPAQSDWDLMSRIVDTLGNIPPQMLECSRGWTRFFKFEQNEFRFLSQSEFEIQNQTTAAIGRNYFQCSRLGDIIMSCRRNEDLNDVNCFIDFLFGLLEIYPRERWNAEQASAHPFITGAAFRGHFIPPPVPRRSTSRPVGIETFARARQQSSSWHPQAVADSVAMAHSMAHMYAMMAVNQLTNSMTSSSSMMAQGPFPPMPSSVGGTSPGANPAMIAALTAAHQAYSNPSCPSRFQQPSHVATSPEVMRIEGFPVSLGVAESGVLSTRSSHHIESIDEDTPQLPGREPSFCLGLEPALAACRLEEENGDREDIEQRDDFSLNGSFRRRQSDLGVEGFPPSFTRRTSSTSVGSTGGTGTDSFSERAGFDPPLNWGADGGSRRGNHRQDHRNGPVSFPLEQNREQFI